MSILSGLKKKETIKAETDTLGGYVVDSGIYPVTIDLAYLKVADSEAVGVVTHFAGDKGVALKQTFWVKSGKAKGGKNYWVDQKGEQHYLPGFNQADAMCQLATKTSLPDMKTKEQVVQLYSHEAKKELPTKVEVLSDLLGVKLQIGVIKQIVDKNAKGDDGAYHATGETREENEVTKMFDEQGRTVTEQRAGSDPVFIELWDKKFTGTVKDKSKGSTGNTGSKSGTKTKIPAKSLFDEEEGTAKPEKSTVGKESLFDDSED